MRNIDKSQPDILDNGLINQQQFYINLRTNEVKELHHIIAKENCTEYWFTDGSYVDSHVIWDEWMEV